MKRWEIEALQDLDNPDDYHVPIRTLFAFAAVAVLVVGVIVWATIAIPPLGTALAGLVLGWYARDLLGPAVPPFPTDDIPEEIKQITDRVNEIMRATRASDPYARKEDDENV